MNFDQLNGRLKWMRGMALDWASAVTGNVNLGKHGRALGVAGQSQAAYGDVKNELKKIGR